jgi:hypothetical protein
MNAVYREFDRSGVSGTQVAYSPGVTEARDNFQVRPYAKATSGVPGRISWQDGVFSYQWEHKPDPAGVLRDQKWAGTTEIYLPAKKLFGTDRPKIVGSGARCEYSDRPANTILACTGPDLAGKIGVTVTAN